MKEVLLIILVFVCSFNYSAEQSYNQYDSLGRKDGLWIEKFGQYHKEHKYYKNGIANGIHVGFGSNNRLYFFGEEYDDKMRGSWYYFDDSGFLLSKIFDFKYEQTNVPKCSHYVLKHASANCYYISYYKNGRIESEGRLFFFDDDPIIDSGEYGLWKYYDEEGNLIKTVEYK